MYNLDEFIKDINLCNGKKSIYTTVYHFEKINNSGYRKLDYDSAVIDKLFFDFDDDDCLDEVRRFHEHCVKENIMHTMLFSGGGMHFYVFVKKANITNKKECLFNMHKHFIDELGLNVDHHITGDLARLTRVPNTYNNKRRRFCIPLEKKDLNLTLEEIREKAKTPTDNGCYHYGVRKLNPDDFDNKIIVDIKYEFKEADETQLKEDANEKMPPCIRALLNNPDATYKERYLIIMYFKEMGYSKKEIEAILEKSLAPAKFVHCMKHERQIPYLFRRDDLMFPTCENIAKDGFCPFKCKRYNKVVYK